MTLKRDGWLLKFARIGNIREYKDNVSLCELFWDCVGTVILGSVITVIGGFVLTGAGLTVWLYPWWSLVGILAVACFFAGVMGVEAKMKQDDSIVRAAYDGIKNKFCPVMKIV